MQHFFVAPDQVSEGMITVTGSDVNHMKNVLRLTPGEQISVSDSNNKQYLCQILRYETVPQRRALKKEETLPEVAVLQILEEQTVDTELRSKIYLFQALPKANKMDTIVQKAVELGVFQILPVLTHRCVVKLDEKRIERRQERWQKIAESAAKQAGRGYIPKVTTVLNFDDALFCAGSLDYFLLPYELADEYGEDSGSVMARTKEILSSIRPGQSVGIFIGPEGGFEQEEVEQAVKAGAQIISLGKRILRTETAGPALLSVLMFSLEE